MRRNGGDAVHVSTGRPGSADGGHTASATFTPPSMRREAREVSGEFDGRWLISVDLGVFRAVRKSVLAPFPVTASAADELRERLKARESTDEWRAKDLAQAETRP